MSTQTNDPICCICKHYRQADIITHKNLLSATCERHQAEICTMGVEIAIKIKDNGLTVKPGQMISVIDGLDQACPFFELDKDES